eukprot:13689_1
MVALDLNTLLLLLCVLKSWSVSTRMEPSGSSPILPSSVAANCHPKMISRDIGKNEEVSSTERSWKEQEILKSEGNCPEQFDIDIVELKCIDTAFNKGQSHPLRTSQWRICRRHYGLPFCRREENESVTFHRNFTLSTDQGRCGKWRADDGSVIWTTHNEGRNETRYRAELFWNVFGDQPRMVRGTVSRDRRCVHLPRWLFRPVIGSFTGVGVGRDTNDRAMNHIYSPNREQHHFNNSH